MADEQGLILPELVLSPELDLAAGHRRGLLTDQRHSPIDLGHLNGFVGDEWSIKARLQPTAECLVILSGPAFNAIVIQRCTPDIQPRAFEQHDRGVLLPRD